jgi:Domain of unknown function (DUF4116)
MSEQRLDFKCVLRARLSKILDLYGKLLLESVAQREPSDFHDLTSSNARTKCATSAKTCLQLEASCISDRDLVLRFSTSDPTPGKSRTQWLIQTYIKDEQFKLEDLGRVHAALEAFERFKRKLPVEQRELSRLIHFRDLEALVDPFVKAEERTRLTRDLSTATGRELRRLEELKARDESIVIQEGKGLPTIAVPMTEFASKWWGRGTKWCTAAEKDNRFAQYHTKAPLVIILCSDGAKFQAHIEHRGLQFMDHTDKAVSQTIIRTRWNEFQSLLYWAIEQNGRAIIDVPEEYQTPDLCRLAVEQNGTALGAIAKGYMTSEIFLIAIKQHGEALSWVPEECRTLELCRLAVQQCGRVLKYVPEEYKAELCCIAVEQDGLALNVVPEDQMTPELCRLAVEQNGYALYYAPETFRTLELCHLAVQQYGRSLQYVPKEYKAKLCRLAVEQNGLALYDVPKKYRTHELCRLAVEQNGLALYDVPKKHQTPELCRIAIQQHGEALYHVPEKHITSELCRLSVEQNGWALAHVPAEYRVELHHIAVERNGLALKFIPKDKRTLELCRLAIVQNRQTLDYVPKELRTPEFMALIQPVQPEWHPDILQGLYKSI